MGASKPPCASHSSRVSSGHEQQRRARLRAGITREAGEELAAAFGVLPLRAIKLEVIAARFGRQPHFMQRFLQVDDDLAVVGEGERHHPAHALIVDVHIGAVVESVAIGLDAAQQRFGAVHEFQVGHYNLPMLKVHQILVSTLTFAGSAVLLSACGQKGPLVLPASATVAAPVAASFARPAASAPSAGAASPARTTAP